MRAAGAVFVVRHAVLHLRDVTRDREPGGIGQVASDDAARVREAVGEAARLRVEQQPRRLARARREHDDARADRVVAAVGAIHVRDAGGQAALVGQHLARHRVGDDAQLAGRQRRRQQHRRRREVRVRRAAAAALAAVVARGPAVQRLREDRQAVRDARDVQLVGRLLDQQLVAARLRRRLEDAVGLVRDAFHRSEDPDEAIELVVVRLDLVVGDRPVVADAVEAAALEVVRAPAQRDAPPVVGAAAEHPPAKPVERGAPRLRVGLALDVPAADAAVELAERLGRRGGAAARRIVRPRRHLRVLGGVPHPAGLEHDDVGAGLAQHLGGHAAAGAGADDADVVGFGLTDDLHGTSLSPNLSRFWGKVLHHERR